MALMMPRSPSIDKIATQLLPDGRDRVRQPNEDIVCGCQHAGRTEATLQRVALAEAFANDLHDRIIVITFDGADVGIRQPRLQA